MSDVGNPVAAVASMIASKLAFKTVAVVSVASWTCRGRIVGVVDVKPFALGPSDAGALATTSAEEHGQDSRQLDLISVAQQFSALFSATSS